MTTSSDGQPIPRAATVEDADGEVARRARAPLVALVAAARLTSPCQALLVKPRHPVNAQETFKQDARNADHVVFAARFKKAEFP